VQLTADQKLCVAQQHVQGGRPEHAEALLQQVLAQQPECAEALALMAKLVARRGAIAQAVEFAARAAAHAPQNAAFQRDLGECHRRLGKPQEALVCLNHALEIDPASSESHLRYAHALYDFGRWPEAQSALMRALHLDPSNAQAHALLGNVLRRLGQLDESLASQTRALHLHPEAAEFHNNLGMVLKEQGRHAQAVDAFHQAVALRADFAEAYNNLGNTLRLAGRLDDAIAAYSKALEYRPDSAHVLTNYGNILRQRGRLAEAVGAQLRAVKIEPGLADAWCNLGSALRARGHVDEALAAYAKALELKPDCPEILSNLGNVLNDKGLIDQAIEHHRRAIQVKPNSFEAHSNLGAALSAAGQLDQAIASFRRAIEIEPGNHELHSNLVYTILFHHEYDGARILAEHRQWAGKFAAPLSREISPHANNADPARRLRIGYVSPDFRLHPVGRFLLPLLAHHDHKSFEIVAYSSVRRRDPITDRLQSYVDDWQNVVGLSDAEAAQKIRADGIDILIDLTLHMAQNRMLLFARRPAPVQATWLGYVGTTGLPAMDYRISDPFLDPPGQGDDFYVEKTLRLPHSFWCYPRPDVSPEINDLPALQGSHVTFGCFNNFCKVTAPTLGLWAVLLLQVKNSHLVIHANSGAHQEAVRQRFISAGIDGSRIRFVASQRMEDYFAQYQQLDLALDPFPYGGGTTTCDALWMGVPVVTLAGQTAVGRAGVSLLSNLGLPELIAQTPEQYLSIARDLAMDLPRLARLRRQLRPMMQSSILMDAPRFAADMETAYRQMWVNWCAAAPARRSVVKSD
jgi:predicted O-linked N-acetylglucosamine transferase (SPINDLY family)